MKKIMEEEAEAESIAKSNRKAKQRELLRKQMEEQSDQWKYLKGNIQIVNFLFSLFNLILTFYF